MAGSTHAGVLLNNRAMSHFGVGLLMAMTRRKAINKQRWVLFCKCACDIEKEILVQHPAPAVCSSHGLMKNVWCKVELWADTATE